MEPSLSDDQRVKRKKLANWIRTNFRKEDTMKIFFSENKYFDIDGVYNAQNDRLCPQSIVLTMMKSVTLSRDESTQPQVTVWLGACSKGIIPLVIFNEGTVGYAVYIENVLSVALKYGNQVLGSD